MPSDADTSLIATPPQPLPTQGTVGEVFRLFLRLGLTAFGGPAAHIALFREEIVVRRRWVTDEHFLDLLGAVNLIPGPNSTEMTIHLGRVRAGWRGMIAAGVGFMLPAATITLALAIAYVHLGTTPAAAWLLYGIKPVVIAIIAQALWGLLGKAASSRLLAAIGLAVFVLYLAGINEIALLFGGGLVALIAANLGRLQQVWNGRGTLTLLGLPALSGFLMGPTAIGSTPVSLSLLFLTIFKISAVLYGSGYVLLAFLRGDFVDRLGWLTSQQLLDAVAVGQFTPGPFFSTATFIGYLVADLPGAVLATLGIFLPSFLFVALTSPLIPRLRRSATLSALLDGVNVAAVGLMAAVALELGQAAIQDGLTALLALGAAGLLIRFRINATWLILAGGLVGLVKALLAA